MGSITPKFPNAIATDSWLTIATNQLQTTLAVPCGAGDTTIGVTDASRIVQWSLLTLNDSTNGSTSTGVSEIVLVTLPPAGNILTVQRGYDGTTARTHAAGSFVNGYVVAWHQKSLAAEVEAIEQTLGPNLANVGTGVSGVFVASPFTPQLPGGNLSPGNNVITVAPVPPGVNGTDTDHWLYIDQGVGTAEPVKITGGSAVSGAPSGTLIISCANAHSGAWRIGTATGGISEAIWKMPAAGGKVALPGGTLAIHAPIRRRAGMPIWVTGQGMQATILAVASDFPNAVAGVNGVFDWSPGDVNAVPVGGATDLTVQFIQPDSSDIALYTHWKPAVYTTGTYHSEWQNLTFICAWDGFMMPGSTNGMQAYNIYASYFHRFFDLDGHSFDTVRLEQIHAATVGLTANQGNAFGAASTGNVAFWIGSIDDLKISSCTVGGQFADIHRGSDGSSPTITMTAIWAEGNYSQGAGDVRIEGMRIASGTNTPMISHSGGNLVIDGFWGQYSGTGSAIVTQPLRDDGSGNAGGTLFCLSNGYLDTGTTLFTVFGSAATPFTGFHHVKLSNLVLSRNGGVAWANAFVYVENGTGDVRLTASHLSFSQRGGGTGVAINLNADNYHTVTGCDGGGWSYILAGGAAPTRIAWSDNTNFATNVSYLVSPARVSGKLTPSALVSLQTENFINPETGLANAIAGALTDAAGVAVPYAAGLKITVLLAHGLQAGANTMNLNGLGAKAIKSGRNPANNIATAYSAGGMWTAVYDGTQFLDVTQ